MLTDQDYLWTSGALILTRDKGGNQFSDSIYWCSSKITRRAWVTNPTEYQKDSCLAFVKETGAFEVKKCEENHFFFCEVY